MVAAILEGEVGAFQRVEDFVFVVFGYVEYEWSEAGVAVVAVLFPDCCASDGDDYAC